MLTVENKIKYVLWTGGWDSTFLFLKLIHDDEVQTIQPIYVAGDGRGSELKEIQTMNDLLPRLRAINSTEIKDLIIINKGDIPENSRITEAYDHIRGIVKIGTQYEWLARLSEQYPGIAIGIEKPSGEYSGCVAAIEKTGRMVNGGGGYYYVDQSNSNDDCNTLFGNFSFPLYEIDERTMLEQVRLNHEEEVMKDIWFCHSPIHNQPCGFCRPCQQKMECDMQWLLPVQSQKRYKAYKLITKIVGEGIGIKMMNITRKL